MVIEVSFKGNRREFFDWPFPEAPMAKTPVIVEVERGEDFGRVHATGELAMKRKAGTSHGQATREPLRKVIRAANGDEVTRATQLRADEFNVRVRAIEKVRALGLDLKVSDTEWQWDRKRLTIYFTSDQRVDFRQLVRQLEGLFGTRVHMWHIGVRDEAKRVDGVGRCGRQLCSAGWLPELVPVKSSVAKDQHLSTLNPAQISGACGRLMCCLRYEHEFYVTQRKRFPKEGRIIKTVTGEEKVLSLDIFRETVTLRSVGGETRIVALARLRQELEGERPPWATRLAEGETAVAVDVAVDVTADADHGADDEGDDAGVDHDRERGEGGGGYHSMEDDVPTQVESAPLRKPAPHREQQREPAPHREPSQSGPPSQTPSQAPSQAPSQPPAPGTGRRRRRGRRGGRRGRGGPPRETDGAPPRNPPAPPRNDEPTA